MTTLSFDELREWLEGRLGQSFTIQIVAADQIVAFLSGPIDTVAEFRMDPLHGFFVKGAADAWIFDLVEAEFVSATVRPVRGIPDELDFKHLKITMRGYLLMIDREPEDDWPDEQQ
jgi:hypothetical protein